ncbi:hypothetical protein ABT160_36580 [Streptomyces sp. NPDC001941]|uniref:ATP-grasp domain-containing protein n=1 Tax=Streptomyces sp. NPDC001941 TaxID=3154659 RepID=UPI00331EAA4D
MTLLPLVLTGVLCATVLAVRFTPRLPRDRTRRHTAPDAATAAQRSVLLLHGGYFASPSMAQALGDQGIRTVVRHYSDLVVDVVGGRPCVREASTGQDVADFGLVRTHGPGIPAPLLDTLTGYLAARGRALRGDAGGGEGHGRAAGAAPVAPSRPCQGVALADAGEPVPDLRFIADRRPDTSFAALAARLGTPFVIRPQFGGQGGELTHLVRTEGEFEQLTESPCGPVRYLAQRYVPNNGTFLLLVLGARVPVVVHRCSTGASGITNRRHASHATLFEAGEFDAEVRAMAVRCAALLGYDVAAVTVVQHRETREWFVLGVDGDPALADLPFADETTRAYAHHLSRRLRRRRSLVK